MLNGITLVAGHWNVVDGKLELTRNTKVIEEFLPIAVTVIKAIRSSKTFMLPLVKTLSLSDLSRSGSRRTQTGARTTSYGTSRLHSNCANRDLDFFISMDQC